MEKLISLNSTRGCEVVNVVVEGTEHLRDDFIARHIQPVIQAKNLQSLMLGVNAMNDTLRSSGAVKDLAVCINGMSSNRGVLMVQPKLKLIPMNKFMAKTGTNVGNGEGDGYMTFQWRNIFGGGENFIIDATTGTRTRSSYLVNYNAPFNESLTWRWDTSAYATSRNIDWSSHEQVLKGLKTKIAQDVNGVTQEWSLQSVIRSVKPYSLAPSKTILAHAGDDLKISLGYDINVDTRDDKVLPTTGWKLGLQNEIAGLSKFSTSHFLKQTFEANWATNSNSSILNCSLRGGWLYTQDDYSHVMDRFYLGGPNDVRSFFYNGLGARDQGDSLGGDAFISGGVSVFTKFPFIRESSGLKLHSFVNFGSLVPWDHNEPLLKLLNDLAHPSVGCGFGVVFKHPVARLELNFVLPLVAHEHDALRKGFQYGIGLQFM